MFSTMNRMWKIATLWVVIALFVAGCANATLPAGDAAQQAAEPTNTTVAVAEVAAPTDTPAAEVVADVAQSATTSRTYLIDPSRSKARYNIFEMLRGSPKTVEGVSTLEGAVTLDPSDLSTATISEIKIDARSFTTDSSMRDGAVRRFILGSNDDAYRYISFTPTAIKGLPASATIGELLTFEVSGDIKIYDTVKPVTFAMSVTATSEVELTGSGSAIVLRSDFGLKIPSVPGVADVADEVPLFIDFVAIAE